jgi:hypothetical protein
MRGSAPVRRAAALLRIHKDTAFRWRHRLLDAARQRDETSLQAYIEMADARFPYLEKGKRRNGTDRDPGSRQRLIQRPAIWATIALDRYGSTAAAITGRSRPGSTAIFNTLGNRFDGNAVLLTSDGPLGAHMQFARALGMRSLSRVGVYQASAPLLHTDTVRTYIRGLRAWLVPFRGVSARYLENYLSWYAQLVRADREHALGGMLHWSLYPRLSATRRPTIPADTG